MAAAMSSLHRYAPLPLLASLILAGCASPGSYPSLAHRPQEDVPGRITGTLTPPAATPGEQPAGRPPAPTNLAALRAEAEAAHARFGGQRQRDEKVIRAGRQAAPGSEAWSLGAVALADLTGAHDATVAALAAIDTLYAAERIDGGDGGAIAAVRDQVTAWVADEDAVLAELGRQ